MTRYKSLLLPAFMTLLGLAVLISLGAWQLQRRDWKLGILERIDSRVHGEPISLSMAKSLWNKNEDVEYYRVLLVGQFLHEQERYLYGVIDGQAGWHVITPLETRGGDIVLVDRGFVPEELKPPESRKAGQITGPAELIGLARGPERRTWFTPANNVTANRWFSRDVPALIASLPSGEASRAAPFLVEAEASPVPGSWPRGGVTRLDIPNRHLEYALTWFGLALALLVFFVLYVKSRIQGAPTDVGDARIADEGSSL